MSIKEIEVPDLEKMSDSENDELKALVKEKLEPHEVIADIEVTKTTKLKKLTNYCKQLISLAGEVPIEKNRWCRSA